MATKKTIPALPPDIVPADLEHPEPGKGFGWERRKELGIEDIYSLKFHHTERAGWVIATLLISAAGRRRPDVEDRTYAIGVLDGKVWRVGLGPHVTRTVEVYLTPANWDRLKKYVVLRRKGLADAGDIRDNISSKRARTALRRSGLPNWY